jgi:transposase
VLDKGILEAALGLEFPWYLASVEADPVLGRLHLGLAYLEGSGFACPRCGATECPIEATRPRTWRHGDFFGYKAFLLARLPDLGCDHCGIVQAPVSWERPGCGFALLVFANARLDLSGW